MEYVEEKFSFFFLAHLQNLIAASILEERGAFVLSILWYMVWKHFYTVDNLLEQLQ